MKSRTHWLRPATAVLAIVAVGVSTAMIAANVSGSATADDPVTVELPVLQPVGYGDTPPELDRDGDPATRELSPVQRTVTVPVGDDGNPEPGRAFRDAVDALAEQPAPDASGLILDLADGEDDPCASEDAEGSEECPDGIRGAIFSVVAPDALWARGSEPHAPSDELPDYAVQCEPVDHARNALPFGFVSNAPGTIVMRYWPVGNAADAATIEARSSAADTAAWEDGLAASDTFEGEWTTINTCLVIEGLTPRQSYNYEFTLTDVMGRTFSSSRTFPFALPDDRTVPPTRIQPMGRNAIMLTAPHRANVRVEFNVQVVDEGETPDCSLTGDFLPVVQEEQIRTVTVSDEFLSANGYLPQYTKRTTGAVWVPEGSTIMACIAEFDDDRPGWRWLEAQRVTWALVQTPDSARPIVSVESVDLFSRVDERAVSMSVSWPNSQGSCGLWTGPHASGDSVPSSELGRECGADRNHPITQDDATVSVTVHYGEDTVNSRFVLPLSGLNCFGTCATPPTAWFSVPLSIEGTPVEMCGSGTRAPCDPADARGAVGAATVRVDWEDGASNGLTDWQVGELQKETVEHELHPLPQMDWLATPKATVVEGSRSAVITFPLKVDREVEYTAEAIGVDEETCKRPSGSLTAIGTALPNRTTGVSLSGACLGTWYTLVVTITDTEGNTSRFGTGGSPWPDARIRTPGIQTSGVYLWYDLSVEQSADQLKVVQLRVAVDGQQIDPLLPENNCAPGTRFGHPSGGPMLPDAVLSERVKVEITMQLAVAYGSTDGMRASCNAGWDDAPAYTLSAVVSPDDLYGPVVITLPEDAPYTGRFTVGRL